MCKSRIFNEILKAVSEETEVPADCILSKSSRADVVDARWIVAILLYKLGIYPIHIAEFLRITPRYVQYIIYRFEERISSRHIMGINYETVKTFLKI